MNFRSDDEVRKPLSIFSYSSLTDIVLLLLIFFLLTSTFVTDFGIRVDIPQAETGAAPQPNFINVTITDDGRYYVMGELVSEGNLTERIRRHHMDNPEATLVVRADKNAIIDNAVRVMNIGQALDMNMLMATEPTN